MKSEMAGHHTDGRIISLPHLCDKIFFLSKAYEKLLQEAPRCAAYGEFMAERFTDTTKWNDDWYLDLPPTMKIVWEYLRDHCDGGTGFLKISFRKMSRDIGLFPDITREEFDKHFGTRVHWVNHETIWIAGYLKSQFKKFSIKNKAHVNMAKKVVDALQGQTLGERQKFAFDALVEFIKLSEDPLSTLDRPSIEGLVGVIGYRLKNKELVFKKEGCGEKTNGAGVDRQAAHFDNELHQIFDQYPRYDQKTEALVWMHQNLTTKELRGEMRKAITNFAAHHVREGTAFKYQPKFMNWAPTWRDWLDPKMGTSNTQTKVASNGGDWDQRAKLVVDAILKAGSGSKAFQERERLLGAELHKLALKAGIQRIREVKRGPFQMKTVAELLKSVAENMAGGEHAPM